MFDRPVIHLVLHALVPLIVAVALRRDAWTRPWVLMMATMVVDVDHLLADPVYAPSRCSIGFHPLHTWFPIVIYVLLSVPRRTRWVGLGLVIHMLLDAADCAWMRLE